ncbi:MAG: hypothetical protein IT385_31110 [Deltaproteobacteria bacterium]|nr:hypothetical protein [Deltaproteobacteria bacterium]
MKTRLFILGLATLGGLACDDSDQPTEVECPGARGPFELGEGRVTGTLEFDAPEQPLSRGDVLTVRGGAHHEDGLAIREVRIAGVSATRDEFNYKAFSASVPYQNIVSAAPLTAQGQVTFQAVAIDACGNRYPFAEATVDVDPTPSVAVDDLTIVVSYPAERTFLPADGSTPALVTITGMGRAVGATVRVSASAGELKNVDDQGDVVLSAPVGTLDSGTATVLFYGTEPGTVTITALVENKLASELIVVAGPPELSPEDATMPPGMSLEVAVEAAGDEVRCRATQSADLVALVDGNPLDDEPVTLGEDRTVVIEASPDALDAATIAVTCLDVYGQSGTGRYTLSLGDGGDFGGDGGGGEEF